MGDYGRGEVGWGGVGYGREEANKKQMKCKTDIQIISSS